MTSEIKKKKIYIFRELVPEIKIMMLDGCYTSDIHVWAQGKGLDINLATFKNYLIREGVSLKKLSHEKVLSAEVAVKPTPTKTIAKSVSTVISGGTDLPEITSKSDFKKLSETAVIDFEPNANLLAEAQRILNEE